MNVSTYFGTFNKDKETITLKGWTGTVAVTAQY